MYNPPPDVSFQTHFSMKPTRSFQSHARKAIPFYRNELRVNLFAVCCSFAFYLTYNVWSVHNGKRTLQLEKEVDHRNRLWIWCLLAFVCAGHYNRHISQHMHLMPCIYTYASKLHQYYLRSIGRALSGITDNIAQILGISNLTGIMRLASAAITVSRRGRLHVLRKVSGWWP